MAVNKVVINQDGVENVLVDITDSTVTPNDMPEGVTAYDKSGEKITGSMKYMYDADLPYAIALPLVKEVDGLRCLTLEYPANKRRYINVNDLISINTPLDLLGNATSDYVVQGRTFTSADGVNITGTYEPLDTSDATATANDIVIYKTAYVNGERVIGQLPYLGSIASKEALLGQAEIDGKKYINLWAEASERGLIEAGDIADLYAPLTGFGDVKPTDVMRGKTYTSSEGIGLTGTGGEMNPTLECERPPWSNGGESVGSVTARVNNENGLILPKTAEITVTFPLERLGNATAEDVLAGKIFSSADGIRQVGTFEPGPGEIEVTDDGNGNLKILNAVVTDNNGNVTVTM